MPRGLKQLAGSVLSVVVFSAAAWAQVKEVKSFKREMEIRLVSGRPVVSMSFEEVFTPRLRKRLSNGFKNRILIDIIMWAEKRKTPVAQGLVHFTIRYDLWDECFYVREEGQSGKRQYRIFSMKELIRTCGSLRQTPLIPLLELPESTECRTEVRITVNPRSKEQLRKLREFLVYPDGPGGKPRWFPRIPGIEEEIQADMIYTYRSQRSVLPRGAGTD